MFGTGIGGDMLPTDINTLLNEFKQEKSSVLARNDALSREAIRDKI